MNAFFIGPFKLTNEYEKNVNAYI